MAIETGQQYPEISRREALQKTTEILNEYPVRAINVIRGQVRRGIGKDVIGDVEGRPEDEHLMIDTAGEHILTGLIKTKNLQSIVYGEHERYYLYDRTPSVLFASDSFDNTSQYKRGLDTPPYSVIGAYHPDGKPIGAAVVDIKDKKAYIAVNGRVGLHDYELNNSNMIEKSPRTTIKDPEFTLATYIGSNEYSLNFFRHFGKMVEEMHPKGLLYGGGGSYIYGLLASGAVDAYVMFNEPRGEIDPGLPLALAAGCTVVSVDPETGRFENYRYEPLKYQQSVPFFIAAARGEVRDEIIRYYMASKDNLSA